MFSSDMKIFLLVPLLALVLVIGGSFSDAQSVPDWVKKYSWMVGNRCNIRN